MATTTPPPTSDPTSDRADDAPEPSRSATSAADHADRRTDEPSTAQEDGIPLSDLEPRQEGRVRRWVISGLLLLGLVLMAGPFVWMVLSSFKTQAEITSLVPTMLPDDPTLQNYVDLFRRLDFLQYFWNSTLIAGLVTIGNIVFTSAAGYALAKIRFRGRRVVFGIVLATLMVPTSVTLVPLYILMSKLSLLNTYAGVILPLVAGPFGVFLMRQFMLQLPDELIEAAQVDGASHLRIFSRIAMPLMAGPAAVLGIFTFLGTWNAFLWPLIVLTDQDKYTLPIALALSAIGENSTDYGLLMAGSVAIITPVVVVFLFFQRRFTESIAMTGIK
ncbi:carbohydrate ABC transporter permease [Salsipaludibacter albus]|uniref:carbohydrate ABC transporter permease n=1 Tax=Salsipaludibacter albus TaxID=2849650 RepID=UPI001EE42307|nr:carbohydrate ABC transporter permease [Salsipaludibacter albus]MBY5164162.1 carbohydrate ABC transporter permease [Salsipaludibacter albus]